MKKMLAILLFILIIIGILIIIKFNIPIISFLSLYETPHTLLEHSDFWNERVHDWLGDTITLVGVMLAFSLPFTAQVVQWVVSTYGVINFPEMAKDELKISSLLLKMFTFVGSVIFWRVFIYDLSPHTSSLYILFNIVIAICFLWILWRLFKIIYYVSRCTFEFRNFIIHPAYEYVKNITDSIPMPYSEIQDVSDIHDVNIKYLQIMELLRDYEMTSFKRGNILARGTEGFEKYIWSYIRASLTTNNVEKMKQALVVQGKLSASLKMMCLVFGKEYYARYVRLASSLAYYTIGNRYNFLLLEEKITENPIDTLLYDRNEIDSFYREELVKIQDFTNNYSDVLFLAEEIEGKNHHDYYPILSCQYLLNHSSFGYSYILPKDIDRTLDWLAIYDRVALWEDDLMELTKRLIMISSKYKKKSALLGVYKNLRNDLQFSHQRKISLYNLIRSDLGREDMMFAYRQAEKYQNISSVEQVTDCLSWLLSNDFDQYFNDKDKSELFRKLLRISYKSKVDDLLLYWLGHLSFDTSIIINVLEEASPIDKPKVIDIGEHLIPVSIEEIFQQSLTVYANDFSISNAFDTLDRYQIVFSTMILYFLAKKLRNEAFNMWTIELSLDEVNKIYSIKGLSIQNVKSLREIAKLWMTSLKSIETNKGIHNLCLNYGINFDNLLNLYKAVLEGLNIQAEKMIQQKILAAPIDKNLISEFYKKLDNRAKELLSDYSFGIEVSNVSEEWREFKFTSIEREWFIDADTGTHYVRNDLDQEFFFKCKYFLDANQNKVMVIFDGIKPEVTFGYKEIGSKLYFYSKYNFYFQE